MSTLIEKLEREYKKWCDSEDNAAFGGVEQLDARGRTRGLKDAIDIVKQHKCTWQGTFNKAEETIYYTLSCGNKYFDDCLGADVECFKYCPFCGGEIEFIEVQP